MKLGIIKNTVLVVVSIICLIGCRTEIQNNPVTPPTDLPEINYEIKAPEFADRWDVGTTHDIIWDPYLAIETIDIMLYKKDEFVTRIAESIPNSGKVEWTVPNLPYRSHHYIIKIVNARDDSVILESEHFYVLQ